MGLKDQKATDRIEQLEKELASVAEAIHYPDCWDTAAYPTVVDAIGEIFTCSECNPNNYEPAN